MLEELLAIGLLEAFGAEKLFLPGGIGEQLGVTGAKIVAATAIATARTPRAVESHRFRLEGRYGITPGKIVCITRAIAADPSYSRQYAGLRDSFLDGVDDMSAAASNTSHALARDQFPAGHLAHSGILANPTAGAVDVLA